MSGMGSRLILLFAGVLGGGMLNRVMAAAGAEELIARVAGGIFAAVIVFIGYQKLFQKK